MSDSRLSDHVLGSRHLSAEDRSLWIAPWVQRLGWAIWVSRPDRVITHISTEAEDLLGLRGDECVGQPCYRVVDARDPNGSPFCDNPCPMADLGKLSEQRTPVRVRVQRPGNGPRWLEFMTIPVEGPDGQWPWLIHCARDVDLCHRREHYLHRVANRSERQGKPRRPRPPLDELTPRETEVLDLLAEDEELTDIATQLCISRVTVRNHVQHILSKLGAHSIQEAVARHLLGDNSPRVS
jgi:DNA-binding CsgD family transcriptional regulator